MSHGEPVEATLDRDIGIVGAVALGVETMIATGIFVLSGLAVSNVGAMAIVAFVAPAVVASFSDWFDGLNVPLVTSGLGEALVFMTFFGSETIATTVEESDVDDAIVETSANAGLTIAGATKEKVLEQLMFGTIPEAVGRRAESTVIMAKRNLGVASWLWNLW